MKTAEQVKKEFIFAGISISSWARENGFSRTLVEDVLLGRSKAMRGKGHLIAVALGIKNGAMTNVKSFKKLPKSINDNANEAGV